jgi:UDP-GlcNAc:undecaprenyl-phosphate GlcNAc-1-phosphate transferase
VFAPDKEHIHHQLQKVGHSHRQAVLLMYFWSILMAGAALAITFINGRAVVGTIVGSALFLIFLSYVPRRVADRRRARRAAVSDPMSEPQVGTKPV